MKLALDREREAMSRETKRYDELLTTVENTLPIFEEEEPVEEESLEEEAVDESA